MVVLAYGTREPQVSDIDGVLAVDFLLQHPSVLQRFASFADPPWRQDVLPRVPETDSSEEALLGWKRSVAGGVVVPMLRRLLGRDLVQRRGLTLALTAGGAGTAAQLAAAMVQSQRERVELLACEFRADPGLARERLTLALPAGRT
jgi:hypothetical protein